jgi:hypothetical protein
MPTLPVWQTGKSKLQMGVVPHYNVVTSQEEET